MNIGGFEPCTLIDYPGKISCIIYTVGCNYRCKFCYNPDIISEEDFKKSGRPLIPESNVFNYINKNNKMIDAVSITGGEPTMQSDIDSFCLQIKKMNKLVKLDTNGSNPQVLTHLIKRKLIDYIAMDLKGPLNKYKAVAGVSNTSSVPRSIELVKNSKIPHEFRLTLYPQLKKQDVIDAISLVRGETIYLQQFEPEYAYAPAARKMMPMNKSTIDEIIQETKGIANVHLRGF
jgi:pyruvate formate lyase activating enzyme